MAQLICTKSSVVFQCQYMPPIGFNSGNAEDEFVHPLFQVNKRKLIGLAGKWAAGDLAETESYLLYLALLDSTQQLIWRCPARYTAHTASIIANNMHSLLHIIGKIDIIKHPSFTLPKYAIGPDTCNLDNSGYWIENWITNYNDWMHDYTGTLEREEYKEQLEVREHSLERLLKTAFSKPQSRAKLLSDWASLAGSFPKSQTIEHPLTKRQVTLDSYWRDIIRSCVDDDRIWLIPRLDLEDLVEHCEEHIAVGSIYRHHLMKLLREGKARQAGYLGLDTTSDDDTIFKPLDIANDAYDANIHMMIMSAPSREPKRENYKTPFLYIKDKAKWDMAQKRRIRDQDINGEPQDD